MTQRRPRAFHVLALAFALASGAPSCGEPAPEGGAEPDTAAMADTAGATTSAVVDVRAVDYAFDMPAEAPAGWTTFRLRNEGREPHFMVLWRLPEGRTMADYGAEVGPAFSMAYDSLEAGTVDKAGAGRILGRELPEWYGEVRPMGGPGMLSPGRTGQTTVRLDPGTYVVECYVKTPEGEFHGELGMVSQLTVTTDSTRAAPPAADLRMALTNASIGAVGPVPAGEHTIEVRFEEHPAMGLGNDIHVARLDEDTDLAELADWMDWMNLGGLRAPAPVEFVGGAHEMPVGATSYFTVELEPGRYAWVSETSAAERLVEAFTVE